MNKLMPSEINTSGIQVTRSGWGYQVNKNDIGVHFFDAGDSLCGKKTGGDYMSSTPFFRTCKKCLACLLARKTPEAARENKNEAPT